MRYRFPPRFTRVDTLPSQALLDGIIKSEPHPIYVFQPAQKPESAAYTIRELNDRSNADTRPPLQLRYWIRYLSKD